MHRNAGQMSTAGKWGGLIALGAAIVILGAWSGHAAELRTPKKPTVPTATAPDRPAIRPSPTLKSPQITTTPERTPSGSRRSGGGASTSTSKTRKPVFDRSPDETEADSSGDPGEDTDPNEDPDPDSDSDADSAADGAGDEYPEGSSEEAGPPADYDELTGKIPGFTPFGGEESGSSEGSTVEGGRPWYEKLGKPGGGRPPVDDDEE